MMIHEITEKVGSHKLRKRIGRGEGSGHGGTSGKGHKGALSRAGWTSRPSYAGGATPFSRRFPKRGFSNADFRVDYHIINIKAIELAYEPGETVDAESLTKKRLVPDTTRGIKVLAEGDLTKKVTVVAARFSAQAKAKIEAAGGTATQVAEIDRAASWKAKRGTVKKAAAAKRGVDPKKKSGRSS
ncbi:MAG: 50S ribosomal protein L15 [Phycisphaerae bacterium]|nr:50S ribosomal protein L15 [Phycisphaerae bacterium]